MLKRLGKALKLLVKPLEKYSLPLEAFEKPLKALVQVVESCSKFVPGHSKHTTKSLDLHSRTFNEFSEALEVLFIILSYEIVIIRLSLYTR